MSRSTEARQLAAFLSMLKNRMDRSYESLAKRTGISSSSLHRYCAGTSIPADYGMLRGFARECGATQAELRELHRLWALADTARRRGLEPATEHTLAGTPAKARPKLRLMLLGAALLFGAGTAWWARRAAT